VDHLDALPAEDVVVFGGGDGFHRPAGGRHGLRETHPGGGGLDDRLGRDTAGEGAVPSDRSALDHHRLLPGPGGGAGCGHAPRAATDDDQIMFHARGTSSDPESFHRRQVPVAQRESNRLRWGLLPLVQPASAIRPDQLVATA